MTERERTRVSTSEVGQTSGLSRVDPNVCQLVVLNTVDKGRVVSLHDGAPTVVGGATECDLVLADPTVSRRHAELHRHPAGVRIRDLGSTNGTLYEGLRIGEAVVPFGSVLSVGKTRLKVVPKEAEVHLTPAEALTFGDLVGADVRMRELFSLLADVAPSDATVLLEGETGTGKELVAHALHTQSERAHRPIVVFDCSSVPRDLIESALFGHVRGAFTGATSNRQGAFRAANGGTIFLDEIGELPLDLQPKLLRVLESRQVQMVGADTYEQVNVRVVAATNRKLKQEVREGRFREDLYYRLAVVRIAMPALRERLDDIPLLVERFMKRAGKLDEAMVDPAGYKALQRYHWPGNVRELKNVVDRALSLHRGDSMLDLSAHLPAGADTDVTIETHTGDVRAVDPAFWAGAEAALDRERPLPYRAAKAKLVDAFEAKYFRELMHDADGNLSRAATLARMDRKHLREQLKRHGLWRS